MTIGSRTQVYDYRTWRRSRDPLSPLSALDVIRSLTFSLSGDKFQRNVVRMRKEVRRRDIANRAKGSTVKVRRSRAAVTGDEIRYGAASQKRPENATIPRDGKARRVEGSGSQKTCPQPVSNAATSRKKLRQVPAFIKFLPSFSPH